MSKPVVESCLRNQQPIAEALTALFASAYQVLEVGSGTGQHAVYCAQRLPHLCWQPTELQEQLAGIQAWIDDSPVGNINAPVELDVRQPVWPFEPFYDGAFTANTVHYVGWSTVEAMFRGLSQAMVDDGVLAIYGAFNRHRQYTSEGNRVLDQWLQSRNPESGLKDINDVIQLAANYGLVFNEEIAMPANNLILVFHRQAVKPNSRLSP